MADHRKVIDRRMLLTFLTGAMEQAQQACSNRFQKRIAAMGTDRIATIIAERMKTADWELRRPDRDADGAVVGRAVPGPPDGP